MTGQHVSQPLVGSVVYGPLAGACSHCSGEAWRCICGARKVAPPLLDQASEIAALHRHGDQLRARVADLALRLALLEQRLADLTREERR